MRRLLLLLTLLGGLLGGCGTADVPTDEPAVPSPPASPAPSSPAPSLPASPAPSPGDSGTTDGEQSEVAETARQQLAAVLGQAADGLTLEGIERVEWNNSALGCEAPGIMYTQIIEPGHKLIFSDGTQTYEVHTSERTGTMIWCDNGQPTPLAQP